MTTQTETQAPPKSWRRASTRKDRKGITAYVDADVHTELQVVGLRRKLSLQDITEEAILLWLRQNVDADQPRRLLERIEERLDGERHEAA